MGASLKCSIQINQCVIEAKTSVRFYNDHKILSRIVTLQFLE